jgi:hypothetical protein
MSVLHGSLVWLCVAQTTVRPHILVERKGEIIMIAQKKNRGAFGRAFAVVSAAIAVSAAVENHRRPKSGDLNTLGIDPKAFDQLV